MVKNGFVYKKIIRPIFFMFPPEFMHHLSLLFFRLMGCFKSQCIHFNNKLNRQSGQSKKLWGMEFPNPIGIAAGFDKNGQAIWGLTGLGFGFIEVGTITPRSQPGNPKPRLFRLIKDGALINRMGFNNKGMEYLNHRLRKDTQKYSFPIPIIINIGKNKDTPLEKADTDYTKLIENLYPLADVFSINISSPNTPHLRELQEKNKLIALLSSIVECNLKQADIHQCSPKPLLLKISPDLNFSQIDDILDVLQSLKLDGIIATNTTIERASLIASKSKINKIGEGGLSGKPLFNRSLVVIRYIKEQTNGSLPIIGVGGISDIQGVLKMKEAGADLVQVYTGFIYEGPFMVRHLIQALNKISGAF